jgi:hypothetical protein
VTGPGAEAGDGVDGHAMTERASSPWRGLAAFTPMCALAAVSWAELLAGPPGGRVAALVALASGCGLVLALSGRLARGRSTEARLVRVATVALALVLAPPVAGIPPGLLMPGGWDELVAGLSRGVEGLPQVWPYGGGDPWVRRTVLLAIPIMTIPAAAFALSPPADGPGGPEAAAVRRVGALLLLVSLVGFAGSERALADPVGRGALLLAALAAWLFLPRLALRRPAALVAAAGAVALAGLASLPLAATLTPDPLRSEARTAKAREVPARARPESRGDAQRPAPSRDRSGDPDRPDRSERREQRRESRSREGRDSKRRGGRGDSDRRGGRGDSPREGPGSPQPSGRDGGGERFPLATILLVAAVLLALGLFVRRRRRRGRPGAADEAERLRRALERLGWRVPPRTTLAELERDLARRAGPDAAAYARGLRERRFALAGPSASTSLDRRALRRDLTAGHGPRMQLLGLIAVPPAALDLRR